MKRLGAPARGPTDWSRTVGCPGATLVSGAGHGTGMYKDHPGLVDAIVRWADRAVRLDGS